MKKIIVLFTILSLVITTGFAQKPAAPKAKASASEDTIQYSLGVYMMQQFFAKTGFVINNPAMFKQAIDDVLGKKKLMVNPATTQDRLLAYQAEYQKQKGRQLEAMLLDKASKEPGFKRLPVGNSAVYFSLIKDGKGPQPTAKDTVILNVVITLPDGTVVDDFNKSKRSYMALAGEVIPGLRELLFRMPEGTICRAIIPAELAYGEAGTPTIPVNSALIYDVALVSVKPGK